MNYINEIDPYCAAWLQNLIDAGHIAPAVIDTRSIEDVTPNDLRGFVQCHFFAGLGGWPYALDLAGWPRDRPVWTGSCPCQPFSAAGSGAGFADERHLWPAWQHLIAQRNPPIVFGEQVASAAVGPWIDLVQADMEGMDYAFGSVAFPAAGIGAPHIRDRTYWVGYAHNARSQGHAGHGGPAGREGSQRPIAEAGVSGGMAGYGRPGPLHGFWRNADWLLCRDGRWRPVESGTFPLAHGVPGRVGRLCAYGNAIVAPQAAEFILAYAEARGLILPQLEVAA